MNKREIFINENKWSSVTEQMNAYGEFFEKSLSENNKILLIGTGWSDTQYFDWPEILLKLEPTLKISYLEICDEYINKWKNNKYPVIKGDVRHIDETISTNEFDVICWMQGPEHINQNEMLSTFEKIFKCAKKSVIFSCPWGSFYDNQEILNKNVFEKHLNKNMDKHCFENGFENYIIKYYDQKDTGNGAIIITRFKTKNV